MQKLPYSSDGDAEPRNLAHRAAGTLEEKALRGMLMEPVEMAARNVKGVPPLVLEQTSSVICRASCKMEMCDLLFKI